jgi:hypothetical protein
VGLGAICPPPPGLPLKQIPTETRRGGAANQAHGNPKTGNSRHQQKEITLEKDKRDEITAWHHVDSISARSGLIALQF